MKFRTISLYLLFILIISPSLLGLIHPGYFASDDGNLILIRFTAFYEAFRQGQLPVRWLPRLANGYGYPVADFLYPLYLYMGVPIKIIGFNFITTIKILFGLSFILSGIFCLAWLRRVFSLQSGASFIGALVYTLFPYHFYDLYGRGSMGEMWALAIVPFILWQIERKSLICISIGIALVILSHNILAFLFLPIIMGYMIVRHWEIFVYKMGNIVSNICFVLTGKRVESHQGKLQSTKKYTATRIIGFVITTFSLGLGLSCFFWLPALYDRQFTVFDRIVIADVSNFFLSSGALLYIGMIPFVMFLSAVIFLQKGKNKTIMSYAFLILFAFSLVIMCPFAKPIWDIFLSKFVQFPFRFLSLTMLAMAYLTSFVLSNISTKYIPIAIILIAFWTTLSFGIFRFSFAYQMNPDGFYTTNMDTTTVKHEYLPKWVKQIPASYPSARVILIKGEGEIKKVVYNGNLYSFNVALRERSIVQLNTFYFPGWHAWIDGKEAKILYNEGIMQIAVPAGVHTVQAAWGETGVRVFANTVSVLSICFILGYLITKRHKTVA